MSRVYFPVPHHFLPKRRKICRRFSMKIYNNLSKREDDKNTTFWTSNPYTNQIIW